MLGVMINLPTLKLSARSTIIATTRNVKAHLTIVSVDENICRRFAHLQISYDMDILIYFCVWGLVHDCVSLNEIFQTMIHFDEKQWKKI